MSVGFIYRNKQTVFAGQHVQVTTMLISTLPVTQQELKSPKFFLFKMLTKHSVVKLTSPS